MNMKIKSVDFNDDLNGFVVELEDSRIVQVQFDKNTDRLSADYGLYFPVIDKQNDYGFDLSDEEEEEFRKWMLNNKDIMDYSRELDA